ncbi:O-antigen ligase family protein [Sphingomonas sp.]|uniref:O-antigen ligase family protein n=1 Tax=Sphingomonas sp. TaxID=28214 RepID=UPI00257CDE9B|nr:O-antigen ligase family protein [Sphingomonas sp.]
MWMVTGFVILNAGFMLLRLPPVGPGVPIGEIVVAIAIMMLMFDRRYLAAFVNRVPFVWLAVFWCIGLAHLAWDAPAIGFWAFRDAAHLFETVYLWIGFVIAFHVKSFEVLYRWFKVTLRLALVYALAYPFRETLSAWSPQISSAGAYTVPLFFSFINTSSSVIAGVVYSVLDRWSRHRLIFLVISVAALVVVIALLQVRVAYLQLAAVALILSIFSPKSIGRGLQISIICIVGVFLFAALDLDFEGRLGTKFTLDFLSNHVQAIWGGGDSTVQGAADGVGLRLRWWQDIQHLVFSDPVHSLFGIGFGSPLTTFEGPEGDITREPHNSFMSVLARYGSIGLTCFLFIQINLCLTLVKSLRLAQRLDSATTHHYLLTAATFFAANMLFSVVEGGFEVSYVAIPYYFLAGTVYGLSHQLDAIFAARKLSSGGATTSTAAVTAL